MAEHIEEPDPEVTVVDGAAELDFHPATIDRAVRHGEIPFRWKRGRRLIRRSALLAWAATRRRNGRAPIASGGNAA